MVPTIYNTIWYRDRGFGRRCLIIEWLESLNCHSLALRWAYVFILHRSRILWVGRIGRLSCRAILRAILGCAHSNFSMVITLTTFSNFQFPFPIPTPIVYYPFPVLVTSSQSTSASPLNSCSESNPSKRMNGRDLNKRLNDWPQGSTSPSQLRGNRASNFKIGRARSTRPIWNHEHD